MKVVLINGPPGSGKDTLGRAIQAGVSNRKVYVTKFARYLKEATHRLYGLHDIAHDHFEDRKDVPLPVFRGISPRDAYIGMSEKYMKPMHGDDIFGRILVEALEKEDLIQNATLIVVTDSGFVSEAEVMLNRFGPTRIQVVQMIREGCTYANDSRGPIDLKQMGYPEVLRYHNDGTFADVDSFVQRFIR